MLHTIITGDIVGSQSSDATVWSTVLHEALSHYSNDFDIFRGDSFQAITPIEKTLEAVFYIMARIQSIEGLQVRVGIGIGEITHKAKHTKQSTGDAFVRSGSAFDALKKELAHIKTPWTEVDTTLNIMLGLCTEIMDRWTTNMAESVAKAIEHPDANQKELARLLHRKYQSQVSTALNKSGFFKIREVINYGTALIKRQC